MKKLPSIFIVFPILFLIYNIVLAEGKSTTTTNSSNSVGLLTGGGGDFSNESLFTGDVAFSVPIGSIGGVNVALNYNSNVHKFVHLKNKDAQAGWIGIGWTLTLGSITADINGTRDVYDDHYYFTSAAGSSELVLISGNEFRLKDYQYWKIIRNLDTQGNLTGWTIVTDDGTIMRYGNYDKASTNFVFDTTGTKATRFFLGIDGVVCNPLNSYYTSANFIAYQWDLSDIQDIAGNHTTITYQREAEILSAGSLSTTLKYTRASYPSEIKDFSGRSIQFILGNRGSEEFVNPPDKSVQRLYETKCLFKIFLKDQNNTKIKEIAFSGLTAGVDYQRNWKRYLSYMATLDADGNYLSTTEFDYYTGSDLGANPGALKSIVYPEGGKVEYVYSVQNINNVKLDFDHVYSTGSEPNIELAEKSMMTGKDFYVVKKTDGSLEAYRWGGTGWFIDNEFPAANAINYWVINDYVVLSPCKNTLQIVKRDQDGWVTTTLTIASSIIDPSVQDSMKVIAVGKDFFVLAHNLRIYNKDTGQGVARRDEDLSIISINKGQWVVDYIGRIILGRPNINSDVHIKAVAGNNFFAIEYATNVDFYYRHQIGVYKNNGQGWAKSFDTTIDQTSGVAHDFIFYGGPDYILTVNCLAASDSDVKLRVYKWPFLSADDYKAINVSRYANFYTADHYFVSVDESKRPADIFAYTFNADAFNTNPPNFPFSITNIGTFQGGNFNKVRVALGNDYIAIGGQDGDLNAGKFGVVYYINGQWTNGAIFEKMNSYSKVIPINNGSSLFAEWDSDNNDYEIRYYKLNNSTDGSIRQICDFSPFSNSSFSQPGLQIIAGLTKSGNPVQTSSHAYMEGMDAGGNPIFSGNPSDFPVATKTVSDGMGNSYTTSYLFENGIYDETMNYAKYNKVTVVPPGNNGKTVTYFYSDLDGTKAEKFVTVPDFNELDGMPYRVEVYSQDNNIEPISSTTNTWTAYAIDASGGVFHKRLSKAESTYNGVTTSTSYEYNNTNGQISRVIEPVQVPTDLQGLRDRVSEITYAYSQPSYSSMQGLNMLSQVYEKNVYSVGPDSFVEVSSDGGIDRKTFSVVSTQDVSCNFSVRSGGYFYIGTTYDGNDVVDFSTTGTQLGIKRTFQAVANKTYYITASSSYGEVTGNVTYSDKITIAAERTDYDSRDNKYYPYKTSVYDGTNWIVTNTVSKRNASGSVTESYNGDGVYSSTKYGYNNTVPVAQTVNAKEGETGYMGLEEGWQDWETGGSSITYEDYHVGSYSAYCQSAYGPTRNFYYSQGLDKNRSYVLEAWVKVLGGIGKVKIEVRDGSNNMPFSKYQDITSSPNSEWQLVRITITPSEMASLPLDGYLRVWCGFPYSTANYGYVDDVRFYPSDAVMTTSTYDPLTFRVTSKSDANNIAEFYIYDTFGRPVQIYNNDRELVSQTDYYSSKENNGIFSSDDPNYVKTSAYPLGEDSNPIVKVTYTDGLGRTIQTHSSSFGEDLVSKVTYDNSGRQSLAYKPNLTDEFVGYFDPNPPSGNYSEKVYYPDPLSRVKQIKPMGSQSSDEWTEMKDGSEVISDPSDPYNGIKLSYTETYQKVGSNTGGRTVSRVYKDKLGNTVRTESYLEGNINKTVSRAKYSMLGKPVSQTDPNGYISSNKYDYLGRLIESTNVDNGITKNAFDMAGRLRFMIDASGQAASPNKTLYWKYDLLGRVIEKGYINENWSSAITRVEEKDYPKDPFPFVWRKKYFYDDYSITPYAKGKLCKVQTNNDDDMSVEVEETFQFDKYGNTMSASQNVPDYEASGTYASLYGYDNMGRVTQMDYPSSFMVSQLQNMTVTSPKVYKAASVSTLTAGPSFTVQSGAKVTLKGHESVSLKPGFTASSGSELKITTATDVKYTYNQLGQLFSIGNSANLSYFAQYSYDENGRISQERLNSQTLVTTYQYDPLKGLLTNISNSKFSETISYTDGYGGESFYNGSIASATFTYSGPYAPAGYSYKFSYDHKNRMTVAEHSTYSDLSYGTSEPLHYDNNGNITLRSVGDFAENGLYYSYYPGTNKIQSVTGNSQDFIYDQNGNVTSNGNGLGFTYDPFTNLTSSISVSGGSVTTYQYDGSKERIFKKVTSGTGWTKTLYLRGMNEYPLTEKVIINSSVNESERFYVYGPIGLIAIIDNGTNYFVVKDHLGSIREVLDKNSSPVSYYNYNPFGDELSTIVNLDSKYQFTGQEFDTESGLFNFRARMYDSRLGIFYSMDPAGQNYSPFSYCGSNPITRIDRDGRFFFLPLFLGMAYGAAIGSGVGALTYSVFAGGKFTWSGFGKAALGGAISGAVSGGLGSFGGALTQNVAYGMLRNAIGYSVSSLVSSGGISGIGLLGSLAGGAISGFIPAFHGVDGGWMDNALAELAYESTRGAFGGAAGGGISALLSGNNVMDGMSRGALIGAETSGIQSVLNLSFFGAAIQPDPNSESGSLAINGLKMAEADMQSMGNGFGSYGPTNRGGGLWNLLFPGWGFQIGSEAHIGKLLYHDGYAGSNFIHEDWHYYQQSYFGWANMAMRIIYEKFAFGDVYKTSGTLEFNAKQAEYVYHINYSLGR